MKWPFYFGIAVPFVLIFVFNIAIFFVVVWSLTRMTHRKKKWSEEKQKMNKEYKKLAVIILTLSVLFGLGWAFGFLIPTDLHSDGVVVSTVAQYIFSILVGFHGVLIFILYCLRSPEVRQEWSRWFVKYVCCFESTKPPLTSTNATTSKPRRVLESPSGESYFLQSVDKHNPVYDSEENVFLGTTSSTYVQPYEPTSEKRPMEDTVDVKLDRSLGSMDALSYASETLLLDFTKVEDQTDEDEEDDDFTLLQELNTRFNINSNSETVEFATTSFTGTVDVGNAHGHPMTEKLEGDREGVCNGRRDTSDEHEMTVI